MSKKKINLRLINLLEILPDKLQPPLGVMLGGSRDVAEFLAARNSPEDICYHMDLFLAEQLQNELSGYNARANIFTSADLWDLPTPLQTLIYPVQEHGERSLKLDMVEQAFHVLQPGGRLIVFSPFENDQVFQPLLKKIFGNLHVPPAGHSRVFWAQRKEDQPRRRHEISFHVRQEEGPSLEFVSRPGVFSYGRFDAGARALVETATIEPGNKILDVGCGCGVIGVQTGLRSGPEGQVVFEDSNLRALALAELNARANGLANFRTVASAKIEGVGEAEFDVAVANPPYFGHNTIAEFFTRRCRQLLRPGGRFYLVTKNVDTVAELVAAVFDDVEIIPQRGYAVFCAT